MNKFSCKCRAQSQLHHWICNNEFFRDSPQVCKAFLRKEGGKTDWLRLTLFDSFHRSNKDQPCSADRAQLSIWPDKLSGISTRHWYLYSLLWDTDFCLSVCLLTSVALLCRKGLTWSILTSWTCLICSTTSNVKWRCSNSSLQSAQAWIQIF